MNFEDFTTMETEKNFTGDAWRILVDYLNNIKSVLNNIPENEKIAISDGIKIYIEEYIDENLHNRLISFNEVLDLIGALGSPGDMLGSTSANAFESNTKTNLADIMCVICNTNNIGISSYCQSCGSNLELKVKRNRLAQSLIDSPYKLTFFYSIIILTIIAYLQNRVILHTDDSFYRIILNSSYFLIPEIIISTLLIGYLIDNRYGDELSFKKRYLKIVEKYEEQATYGFIGSLIFSTSLMGPIFGLVLSKDKFLSILFGVTFGLVILVTVASYLSALSEKPKPEVISHFNLLNYKRRYDLYVREKVYLTFKNTVHYFIMTFVLIIVVIQFALSYGQLTFTLLLITSLGIVLIFLSSYLGVLYILAYSPSNIKKVFEIFQNEN